MSHFVTLVIIPGNTPEEDIGYTVERMLEPYSEHLSVTEYETDCFCIGVLAHAEVEAKVNEKYDLEQLREQFHSLPKNKRTDKKWDELIAPRMELRKQLLDAHPMKGKPNPNCESCRGTGTRISQYNPDSKWDWWVIGGRWDGWIHGPEREKVCRDKEGGFNFGDEHHQVKNNCRRVSEIPIDDPHYIPFSILTPENAWVASGDMGWWAIVSNEMPGEQWHQSVKAILAKYPEHLAVAVDCHI